MEYARAAKISVKAMILTTPIGLHNTNFSVKEALNMSLKLIKYGLNIRFVLKQINPAMATIVINKTNIIFITSRRGQRRTPNICMNKLKWCSGNTMRMSIR